MDFKGQLSGPNAGLQLVATGSSARLHEIRVGQVGTRGLWGEQPSELLTTGSEEMP